MIRTRKTGLCRLRLTIGLTPVSFGSNRTKENPSFRIFRISATSTLIASQDKDSVGLTLASNLSQFHERIGSQTFNQRSTKNIPIVVPEVKQTISVCTGISNIKRRLGLVNRFHIFRFPESLAFNSGKTKPSKYQKRKSSSNSLRFFASETDILYCLNDFPEGASQSQSEVRNS